MDEKEPNEWLVGIGKDSGIALFTKDFSRKDELINPIHVREIVPDESSEIDKLIATIKKQEYIIYTAKKSFVALAQNRRALIKKNGWDETTAENLAQNTLDYIKEIEK